MASAAVSYPVKAPHELSEAQHISSIITSHPEEEEGKPRDVYADFAYYVDSGDGSMPAPHYVDKPETFKATPVDNRKRLVRDMRGSEQEFNLDKNGFEIYKHMSEETEFVDDRKIETVFYPEVERILKERTGASKVFVYEHTIRRQEKDGRGKKDPNNSEKVVRGPVHRLHVDHSAKCGPRRVTLHLPEEAPSLLAGRVQIINVWRPLKPIYKDPLAVVDARSVPASDLLPVPMIYSDREAATLTVLPGKEGAHEFYYLYGQQPDELMLFKNYDSKTDGRARFVPHSAFVDSAMEDREARESVELRCLVFHPEDKA
ncbi:MAG: hypothetical protein M1827_006810 [Pycnora praestabilis]|nr:MAG: hypothetical protein M1827_006810 [Pycnora praestabilis]